MAVAVVVGFQVPGRSASRISTRESSGIRSRRTRTRRSLRSTGLGLAFAYCGYCGSVVSSNWKSC
jgi:hypothetical protein